MVDKERFERICELFSLHNDVTSGFSTYNEKRLHMILKRLISSNEEHYEQKVGNFVADVFDGERIYEIQTASLYPLKKKLEYYLRESEYPISVIKPFIASKRLVRVEIESGEVLRCRRSPKKAGDAELFTELYKISDFLSDPRLEVVVLYVDADEYRYSDEIVRYRKRGKYDAELFPRALIEEKRFCGAHSFEYLLDSVPNKFTAKEYGTFSGLSGRGLYSLLNLLCKLSLLKREKTDDGIYEYTKIK